jgi:hypothetical protein
MAVLCLHYPNGRIHRMTVPTVMKTGEEFDLFARRWRVIGEEPRPTRSWRYQTAEDTRGQICRQVAAAKP